MNSSSPIYFNRIYNFPHTKEEIIWNPLQFYLFVYNEATRQGHSKKYSLLIIETLNDYFEKNKSTLFNDLKLPYLKYLKYKTAGHKEDFLFKLYNILQFFFSVQLEGNILEVLPIPFVYQDKLKDWINNSYM